MIKYKKATDKIISIYWFTILFIVAAGIVYMAVIFYGNPLDVREKEANILINNIVSCLYENHQFRSDFFDQSFKDNFAKLCRLNFNTENFEEWNNDQYYVEIKFTNPNTNNLEMYFAGDLRWKDYCSMRREKNLPVCAEREVYAVDMNQNKFSINISSVVRKTEKNAK